MTMACYTLHWYYQDAITFSVAFGTVDMNIDTYNRDHPELPTLFIICNDQLQMTAAHRYTLLIQEFCSKFLTEKYDEKIQSIYLYNPPAIISVLRPMFSPFISANIRSKIIEC